MTPAERFPFVERDPRLGAASLAPFLPVSLKLGTTVVQVQGLLDTGATVNVLPYAVGVQLGAAWGQQTTPVKLTGNLGGVEARGLLVTATVGGFAPVRLAFAWAEADALPVLLGQLNFFLEFDVCFFRSQGVFEVRPKQPAK
jgi:hypothetical protein